MSYRNYFQNNNNLNQSSLYDYGKSFAGVGRFDPSNMVRPANLSYNIGANNAPRPLNTLDPNFQNILAGYGSNMNRGNIDYSLTDRITDGVGNFRDKITDFKDTISGGITNILDNTLLGRIGAARDATNPNAGNYNPALQGQIDFMRSQGMYGTNPTSGLNQITSGVLRGKNLQSGFGSNDLAKMYDKSIARTQKTIDNLSKQWSRLKEEDPEEYAKKEAYHRALLQKKQNEKKKYFDNLKKKTTTSGGDGTTIITNTDQSGKGDGGGGHVRTPGSYDTDTSTGGSGDHRTASTSSSSSNKTRHHALAQGGLASIWPR